ncbi:hypothetical protein [uncultured Paracoccus sp.]|uniref:hypothetical protein n=1 Tax=uncultured Paracoccus sp. TaxID=189685 RepID=UPI00262D8149|nr:hypothetical protein [uncultured Paracoccus sp.]
MIKPRFSLLLVAVAITACEVDPNAPQYQETFVEVGNVSVDVETAYQMCSIFANDARQASLANADRISQVSGPERYNTQCRTSFGVMSCQSDRVVSDRSGNAWSSIGDGMRESRQANQIGKATLASCMLRAGYVSRSVCVANCAPPA